MAYGFVQIKSGYAVGAASLVITFTSAVSTNNRVIADGGAGNSALGFMNAVSDNASGGTNSYASDLAHHTGTVCFSDTWSANIARGGGSALAVTLGFSASDTILGWIQEISGLDTSASPVRTSGATEDGTAQTAHTAVTAGVCAAGDYVHWFNHDDGNGGSQTARNSVTLQGTDTNTAHFTSSVGDKAAAGGATETAGTTTGNGIAYVGLVVAYKLAAAAATPAPPIYAMSSN